jgi:DNA-binding ferritin-like protein (Dps family)
VSEDEILVAHDSAHTVAIFNFEGERIKSFDINFHANNGFAVGDVNGDGRDEILVAHDSAHVVNIFILNDATTIAHYKEDFMLTGFSVTENHGSDAGLFYSADDKNQTMNAYMVLRYEFLYSQNTLSSVPAKLTEHNVSVTHKIKHFAHQDAALIGMMNMTKDALHSLPEGKTLPIAFAYADSFAGKAMRELSDGYIMGTDYDVNLTDEPEITTKIIKMHWYNTTTDERLEPAEIIEEVETWGLDDDEKAITTLLLLAWALGEISMPGIGTHEADFFNPEKKRTLEMIGKGVRWADICAEFFVIGGVYLIANYMNLLYKLFLGVDEAWAIRLDEMGATRVASTEMLIQKFLLAKMTVTWEGADYTIGDWMELFRYQSAETRALNEVLAGDVATATDRIMAVAKWIGRVLIILAVVLIIAEFLYIAYKEGWTGFGFALGAAYAIMGLIYLAILVGISCIPVVGWIIALVIIIADLIATFVFHHGSGWLMKKLVSLFIDFKLRSKIDLKLGDTSVNIEDNDDNGGLTVGDKFGIKSWFWAKTWETKRGKEHGDDHHDYRMSYIHPKYEYKKHDSTFDSGSYHHYCDSSEDQPTADFQAFYSL